jgi:hypothetical protein
MIDSEQEIEERPPSLQDSTVEDEIIMMQETTAQDNINTTTPHNDSEILSQEDCSNRPDPPSIIDGEEEVPPRGDIPTAVSTLETNQSLLSEDDFSVSDTQKESLEGPENDNEELLIVNNNDQNGVMEENDLPEDSMMARPNRIARDPSISLVDVFSPTEPQQSNNDNEIQQAVEELHVRRMAQPVWDDNDEDGLVRQDDVGRQHVRERLTPRIELLPPIEERRFLREPLQKQRSFENTATNRRRIRLLLQEEMDKRWDDSFIGHIRRRSALFRSPVDESQYQSRGHITISWYEGTSTLELNEHVRNSAMRKLKLASYMELKDLRFLDESIDPPEGMCEDVFGMLYCST